MTESHTKELKLLEKASMEFSKKILAPEREENDKFPFGSFFGHVLEKAYQLDFFHIRLPETMGGMGHSVRAFCTMMDHLCREDSSLGGVLLTNAISQDILIHSGNEVLMQSISEKATGVLDFLMAFPALINPIEQSALPRASQVNGHYTISGVMDYLVLGGIASHAVVPARIQGQDDYSFFFLDLNEQGIRKSETIMSHGLHACPAVDVSLTSAKATLLGDPGLGDHYFKASSGTLQLVATAMSLGLMKGSLNEAMAYCSNRVQGGRKLKDWTAMQMMLSDMSVQTHVADMLVRQACDAVEKQDKNWPSLVQAASIHIQSAATQLTTDGIQALGGVGYMKDFGQEKRFRDAGQIQALFGHTHMKKLRFIRQYLN